MSLVEGFYDDVIPLDAADRDQIAAIGHDETEYKEQLGVNHLFGEPWLYSTRTGMGSPDT